MKSDVVLCQVDRSGIGTITINRPDVRNAYNAELLEALTDAVNACGRDETVRVIDCGATAVTFRRARI